MTALSYENMRLSGTCPAEIINDQYEISHDYIGEFICHLLIMVEIVRLEAAPQIGEI
jgi:hypothetical protein